MTTPAPSPRNSIKKVLLPVAGILVLVVGGLSVVKSQFGRQTQQPAGGGAPVELKIGATLPDFPLKKFGGDEKPLQASELKAKVLLVNFWATWCEACMVEMPSIVKLRNGYKEKGFEVAAVNMDENPGAVLPKTIQQLGINFPVFTDTGNQLADLFDIHAIPLTVVLDKDRKILLIESGERDWNGSDFRSELERWLSG